MNKNKKKIILFFVTGCLFVGFFLGMNKAEASIICNKEKEQQREFKNKTNRILYWKMYWIQNYDIDTFRYFKNFCKRYDSHDKDSLNGLSANMQKMCWQYLMFKEYDDYLDYKNKCNDDDDDDEASVENTFTLTYNVGEHGAITGTSSQTVDRGGSCSAITPVNGVPDPDCPDCYWGFHMWSDGYMDKPRIDTNVTSNINVTAEWWLLH